MTGLRKIKITGTPPACTVEVDGTPMAVLAIDLHLDAKSLPVMTVQPDVHDIDVYIEGDVKVDEWTERTLRAIGWMPPAGLR